MNYTTQDRSRNIIEKPYTVEGQLVELTNVKHEYMDERIFHRRAQTIDATNLGILVDGSVIPLMFPNPIDYKTGADILNQKIRYTRRVGRVNKPEDFMQEAYKINKYTLEILSGSRKDEKYQRIIIT
jgi:hypothetical protein